MILFIDRLRNTSLFIDRLRNTSLFVDRLRSIQHMYLARSQSETVMIQVASRLMNLHLQKSKFVKF